MNGYYGLLNIIKTSLQQNGEVNTVTTQDIDVNEIFSNFKKDLFPFANIITNSGTIQKGVTTFSVEIELADLIDTRKEVVSDKFNGITNEIDIYNTTYYTLRRVADQLINDVYTEDLTIVGEPTLEKFKDIKHNACGWLLSFDIEVPNVVSYCVDIPELPAVTCDLSYTENGGEYTITWTSDNAEEIYLNGSKVAASGQIVTTTPEDGYLLLAKRGIDTCFSRFIIAPVDPRIDYANRIAQDGGEIIGFDQLANNINAPVGRKVGKLYKYGGDDYSVVRNGEAWEFTRNNKYEKIGIDVPRFDWTNGKQELLVEGQATNYFVDNTNYTSIFKRSVITSFQSVSYPMQTNSFSIIENTADDFHLVDFKQSYAGVPSECTISGFIKSNGKNKCLLSSTFGGTRFLEIDFVNEVATPSALEYPFEFVELDNGWFRFKVTFKNYRGDSNGAFRLFLGDNYFNGYQGDGVSGIYILGLQIEIDTKATSPILTNGQIKTRPADIITNSQGQLANGRYENV